MRLAVLTEAIDGLMKAKLVVMMRMESLQSARPWLWVFISRPFGACWQMATTRAPSRAARWEGETAKRSDDQRSSMRPL